jgi:peroxiredoxin
LQAEFDALGVQIVAVGFDSPADNQAWAVDEEYTYEIWTDDNHTLAFTYGSVTSKSASTPGRVTVMLDGQGDLVLEYAAGLNISTHPEEVLADAQALFGG